VVLDCLLFFLQRAWEVSVNLRCTKTSSTPLFSRYLKDKHFHDRSATHLSSFYREKPLRSMGVNSPGRLLTSSVLSTSAGDVLTMSPMEIEPSRTKQSLRLGGASILG
jgi:hypothetical protein